MYELISCAAKVMLVMQNFLFHTNKQLGPHLATAKKHSLRAWAQSKKHGWQAWLASKKHTNAFLASPQVSYILQSWL